MSKQDVVMPQMGESIAEGTIIKWLKKEGEKIERDEILLEISTDKVDSEIPSPHAGVLRKILAQEGETVEVGSKIAEIESDGDGAAGTQVPEKQEQKAEAKEAEAEKEKKEAEKKQEAIAKEAKKEEKKEQKIVAKEEEKEVEKKAEARARAEEESSSKQTTKQKRQEAVEATPEEKKFFSPLVRNIAKTEGIGQEELEQIEGSGAYGRVTKKDILGYIESRAEGAPAEAERKAPTYVPGLEAVEGDERVEIIPMDRMRKSIAAHMVQSVQTSPHVFAVSEADMTDLVRFREQNKERFLKQEGFKLTYMPFIIDACAKALRDFPLVNSSLKEDNIIRKKYINVGVAVALENNGLIVPVIKGADGMNIVGLARVANDLAVRARSRKLNPDEVQDGTFSITNMGVFGSIMGLPIINQPQVAILGVGVIQKRPVVINNAIAIRDMMYISLSFDHRIVDGALGGQFLDRIAHYLTNYDIEGISL